MNLIRSLFFFCLQERAFDFCIYWFIVKLDGIDFHRLKAATVLRKKGFFTESIQTLVNVNSYEMLDGIDFSQTLVERDNFGRGRIRKISLSLGEQLNSMNCVTMLVND